MEFCTNCGIELKDNIKFCSSCGFNIADPKTNNIEKASVSFKQNIMDYFKWLKDSIMHPSNEDNESRYFGLVSLFFHSLIMAYSFFILTKPVMNIIVTLYEYLSDNYLYESSVPKHWNLYSKLALIVLIYFTIYIIIGFLFKRYLSDKQTTLLTFSNQLGRYSNSLFILEIILILFILTNVPHTSFYETTKASMKFFRNLSIIYALISTIWNISYISSIIITNGKLKLDRIYVALLAIVANNIGVYILLKIVSNSLNH